MEVIDEDRKAQLHQKAPQWVKMVNDAKEKKVDYIIMMLDAFVDDAGLLFNALWYAQNIGVSVLVSSPQDGSSGNTPPKVSKVSILKNPDLC